MSRLDILLGLFLYVGFGLNLGLYPGPDQEAGTCLGLGLKGNVNNEFYLSP